MDPAPLHEHALSHLRYIREAMEGASTFTSIPGWGGVAVGAIATLTAVVAHPLAGTRQWLLAWLACAAVSAVVGWVAMWRKAGRANVSFRGVPARRFFSSYFAPIAAAAALTFVLGREGHYGILPVVWLLLYGASFVSSGAYSIPVVPVMGLCFMILGAAASFAPDDVNNLLMGAGFGGLHVGFGVVIARRYGG